MKKTLVLVSFLLLAALPSFAQNNEVTLLVGGAKALKTAAGGKSDFQHGFEEISYGVQLDQGTIFKLKVGRMDAKTVFVSKDSSGAQVVDLVDPKGQVEYADAVVEYRFSEPFGYTGLFAGTGLYHQSSGTRSESDYGFVGGVNGLFPITRSLGVTAEGAYHWAHFYSPKPRYGTVAVGLRFAF
ncbi:MAG TPA: hypothetical protein VNN08_06555 [Thermoanaerobaculia bacterium]|nr:hypothetical protein [Thermoanaerobaculia bacterium]